jgi:hypothetical protein
MSPVARRRNVNVMQTYMIVRRNGWRTPEELEGALKRSREQTARMNGEVRWICSYALDEQWGKAGTVCIYEASSPEAIRDHAAGAGLPIDEIVRVADTVVVRPDRIAAAA